jgi:hypothetical protein
MAAAYSPVVTRIIVSGSRAMFMAIRRASSAVSTFAYRARDWGQPLFFHVQVLVRSNSRSRLYSRRKCPAPGQTIFDQLYAV